MALVLLKSFIMPNQPSTKRMSGDRPPQQRQQRQAGSSSLAPEDLEDARPISSTIGDGEHAKYNRNEDKFSDNFTDLKASILETCPTTHMANHLPGSFRINPRMISDATIGLSDGLTVPFALTAGLSALGDTNVVIYGGLAELIAGGISMGLGGYLGAKSEAEAYAASLVETKRVVLQEPEKAARMVRTTFESYDFAEDVLAGMVCSLGRDPSGMVEFLMRFHHQLTEADYAPAKAYVSGLTISVGYVTGGLVALLPYLFLESIHQAFVGSVAVMALALFWFGWAKTALVGESDRWVCLQNGVQMMVLGGVAAGAAMGCVKALGD